MPSTTARDFQRLPAFSDSLLAGQRAATERSNHPHGRSVTIPIHGGREIGPPLFFEIIRQLGMSLEEFERLR
jgi:hypothetical protein